MGINFFLLEPNLCGRVLFLELLKLKQVVESFLYTCHKNDKHSQKCQKVNTNHVFHFDQHGSKCWTNWQIDEHRSIVEVD